MISAAKTNKGVWVLALVSLAGCASGTTSGNSGGNGGGNGAGQGSGGSTSQSGPAGDGQQTSATADADGGAGGTDDDDQQLSSSSFGTQPVGGARPRMRVIPHWITNDGRLRVVCEHVDPPAPAECPQCPLEPSSDVRDMAFSRVERRVLRCNPPADRNGLLPVRAAFGANGLVQDVSFPHVNLDEATALCLGRGLCRMRVPTFRSPQSVLGYDYQIYTAPPPPDAPR